MSNLLTLMLVVLLLGACGTARGPSEQFIVLNSIVDKEANSIVINIRVTPPASQEDVSRAAEAVIKQAKMRYPTVTVRSYLPGADPSGAPYALSILADGKVTHRFDPRAATRKIPTH